MYLHEIARPAAKARSADMAFLSSWLGMIAGILLVLALQAALTSGPSLCAVCAVCCVVSVRCVGAVRARGTAGDRCIQAKQTPSTHCLSTTTKKTEQMHLWGWRVPFLLVVVSSTLALLMRMNMPEPDEFVRSRKEAMDEAATRMVSRELTRRLSVGAASTRVRRGRQLT